jgi:hypothetical protein
MSEQKPRFPIRRFDVFAEYNRAKNEAQGMSPDVAKGRAIWAAKVVAGRRYGSAPSGKPSGERAEKKPGEKEEEDNGFRSVGGELQTDRTFDKEIVDRMGREFYHDVFQPAVDQAFKEGKRYEEIRDSIREEWK